MNSTQVKDSEKETVDLQFNKENSSGRIEHDLFR